MVSHNYLVVTLVIIITVIIVKTVFFIVATFAAILYRVLALFCNLLFFRLLFSVDFLGFIISKEINHFVIEDFSFFIVS